MLMTQAGGAFLLVAVLILFVRTGSFEFSALSGCRMACAIGFFVFILKTM